uniref:Small ribosomal subunit protein uS9c n=1 Tax=Lobochlamys segnis TaxID=52035 RepID=A0A0S2IBG1_9CHLO|nr:ribosomal protein S9 [Lobochlamys segnis]
MEILAKAVGRRKEAVAQVQIIKGTGQFLINNKPAQEYLQNNSCSLISVKLPFEVIQTKLQTSNFLVNEIDTIVKVKGGGLIGQSDAIKLGIARAICSLATSSSFSNLILTSDTFSNKVEKEEEKIELISNDSLSLSSISEKEVKKQLKLKGLLTQDSRIIERKKYGLRKARKAPQYHKR